MYPTYDNGALSNPVTFHELVKDESVEQDLIIFFENGEILRASDGDIVADSFSFTEYFTQEEDLAYGEVCAPTFTASVLTSVFDAKNPTGWARVYIGAAYEPSNGNVFPTLFYPVEASGQFIFGLQVETPSGETIVVEDTIDNTGTVWYLNPETGDTTTQGTLSVELTRITTGEDNNTNFQAYYHTGSDPDAGYYKTQWYYDRANTQWVLNGLGETVTKSEALRPCIMSPRYYATRMSQLCMPGMLVCPLGEFYVTPDDIMSGNTIQLNGVSAAEHLDDVPNYLTLLAVYDADPVAYVQKINWAILGANAYSSKFRFPSVGSPTLPVTYQVNPAYAYGTSWREVLGNIGASTANNITVGRDGALWFIESVVAADALDGTRIEASAYTVSRRTSQTITGLAVYDEDGTRTVYGTDGVNYELPYSPLLQGQDSTYYTGYLSQLQNQFVAYHPQSLTVINADPSVEAGDTVTANYGGSLGSFTFPVMAQTITFPGRCVAEYSCTASVNRNARTSADYSAMSAQKTADEALTAAKGKVPFMGEESSDLDNCTEPGFYDYLAAATNNPVTGAGGALIVIAGPSPYIMQYAMPRDSSGVSTAYVRQYTSGGTWGAWAQLLTEAPAPTWTDITSSALSAADTSKATIGSLKLYACGNMRLLQGYITAVNLPTTQTTVANITTGNRPADQVAVSCAWDSARYVTWGVVGTGGAIAIRSSSAYTSGNLRLNAMWLV